MSTPRSQRKPDAGDIDLIAGELAGDMLAFMAARFANASEEERLELTMRYAPVLSDLQKALFRANRARQRRRYPGKVETK